jgi:hypothetical protein
MEQNSNNSEDVNSDNASTASQTSGSNTYVVLNLLPPSRLEWLRQQSLKVADVFHRVQRSL